MSEEEEKKSQGNPILGALDSVLTGARKFLAEQKMLKAADEFAYLALRKGVDALKNTFVPMKIEGKDLVPDFQPAILCSIVEQPLELALAASLTPRKVHFMVPAKFFETPGLQPMLEAIGAYRSTKNKEDMEPVQKTVQFLTKEKDLVAMVPIDTGERERLDKTFAGILKFAAGVPCQLIPYASTSMKNFKLGGTIKIKVGEPIEVAGNIKRDARYKLAAEIVDKIMAMKQEIDAPEE